MTQPQIDDLDRQLIEILSKDARTSNRRIAADLGVEPHLVQTVLQQHVADLLTEAADRFDPPGLGNRGADR